jgi:hypothetical protein
MKRFLLFLLLSSSYFSVFATDYYSQAGQSNPNDLNSWNTMQDGTGAPPGNFTNAADRFIIQDGHTMTTAADWSVSNMVIQNGGILQGDHVIFLSGTFQIDDGGTYIHNNAGSVSQDAGMSIFSGTESFAANSNFEIWKWNTIASNAAPLPNTPAIIWGNLAFDIKEDIGEVWSWGIEDGSTLTIAGSLKINGRGYGPQYRMTGSGIQTINVGGDFWLDGNGIYGVNVFMKKTDVTPLDGYTTMQVNGNIILEWYVTLDLGINTTYPNPIGLYELRYKGYIGQFRSEIKSTSSTPYLVANGTTNQNLDFFAINYNCNMRVAPGSTLSINGEFSLSGDKRMVVLGTLNQSASHPNGQNGWYFSSDRIEIAGGTLNGYGPHTSSQPTFISSMRLGDCTVCTGNGNYDYTNNTWCSTSGSKGTANFLLLPVILDRDFSSLNAGHPMLNSPGDIYFVSSTADVTNPSVDVGYTVSSGSVFSIDRDSYISGTNAGFNSNGGTLRIGSPDGITGTGNTSAGNVRVGGNKVYSNTSVNTFEYFGTNSQSTGDGLPATIAGILKINNTSDAGTGPNVTLSQPTTVTGSVDFVQGKLLTTSTNLLTIADNATTTGSSDSYVIGPLRKIGDDDFSFPIGKGNIYSPVGITAVSGSNASDVFTTEYFRSNPQTDIGNMPAPGSNIDHISSVEYWTLDRDNGAAVKKVSLKVNDESNCTNISRTFVSKNNGTAWTNEGTEIIGTPETLSNGHQTGTIRSANAISDFSPFTLATDVADIPLPIKLLSFDATKLNSEKALVNWELSEFPLQGSRFEVQRANDGRSFVSIGNINGDGASKLYNYIDNGLQNGINYYRLKMIDEDNKITYSKTVAILNGLKSLLLTSLIPTIVNHSATLTISSSKKQKLDLVITDMYGRIIQKQNYSIVEGNTNIQISTASLAAGMYQVFGTSTQGRTNMIKFVKQ